VRDGVGIEILERVEGDLPPLSSLPRSKAFSQSFPSSLVGHAMDIHVGDLVLDMCSSPGGKASHFGLRLLLSEKQQKEEEIKDQEEEGRRGFVISVDRGRGKVKKIKKLVEEMGLEEVVFPLVMDSTNIVDDESDREETKIESVLDLHDSVMRRYEDLISGKLPKTTGFPPESFDKVLLDPSCSALGLR